MSCDKGSRSTNLMRIFSGYATPIPRAIAICSGDSGTPVARMSACWFSAQSTDLSNNRGNSALRSTSHFLHRTLKSAVQFHHVRWILLLCLVSINLSIIYVFWINYCRCDVPYFIKPPVTKTSIVIYVEKKVGWICRDIIN